MKESLRVIQISDTHIYADSREELLGVNTRDSLAAVLDNIKKNEPHIDAIFLNGDLSQDGSKESYLHIIDVFKNFNCPVYCLPGNHDDGEVMIEILPNNNLKMGPYVQLGDWIFILLDSHQHHQTPGFFSSEEFAVLIQGLKNYPHSNIAIIFHHQPVPVGSAWLDNSGVKNAEEFWETIKNYSNIKLVLFSHVHQEFIGKKNEIKVYSNPSTCIQFKQNSQKFALEEVPQGYRWIDLYANGEFKTGVKRLPHYSGQFLPDAKGY